MLVTVAIVATTFWGSDDFFPFAPFRMYAFSNSLDGQVNSAYLEGVNADGARFRLTEDAIGMRRAEMEGQLSRFRESPEDLELIAMAYQSANPDRPELIQVDIVMRRYQLDRGKPTGEETETVEATWHTGDEQS